MKTLANKNELNLWDSGVFCFSIRFFFFLILDLYAVWSVLNCYLFPLKYEWIPKWILCTWESMRIGHTVHRFKKKKKFRAWAPCLQWIHSNNIHEIEECVKSVLSFANNRRFTKIAYVRLNELVSKMVRAAILWLPELNIEFDFQLRSMFWSVCFWILVFVFIRSSFFFFSFSI